MPWNGLRTVWSSLEGMAPVSGSCAQLGCCACRGAQPGEVLGLITCWQRLGLLPPDVRLARPHAVGLARSAQLGWVDVTRTEIWQAGDADLAALAELRREWTREQGGDCSEPGFGERLAAWFGRESSHRVTWLAEVDGRSVGMMNLAVFERMPRPGRAPSCWGYLANAFVLAAYRDQGIGSQLISALLGYADEHRFARVVLSPSDRSIPFYERAGFGPADALMLRTSRPTANAP